MARKSGEIRQKLGTEQGRGENVREECSVPRGKCAAKRRIWERIVWGKKRANNIESKDTKHRGRI